MADFEKLYEDYYHLIYKFLLSLCKDFVLCEELTQETFYRAFINIKKLRDDAKAVAWLCSIAKNLYFAWYKENKKFCCEEYDEALCIADVADTAETKILNEECMKVVNSLEPPYKEVFMLSVFAGLSFKDISCAYSKSESWARVTFYRAKQKMLEGMKQK